VKEKAAILHPADRDRDAASFSFNVSNQAASRVQVAIALKTRKDYAFHESRGAPASEKNGRRCSSTARQTFKSAAHEMQRTARSTTSTSQGTAVVIYNRKDPAPAHPEWRSPVASRSGGSPMPAILKT